ncbi:SDR family NAD(P)-dependent oxidoreductase [Paracoccus sp. DMF-8]|uniref:SDR family NAD(P)-dependent oxidoreductase n=1 Tax=Paracoccus sp. DMF-8 TaxID=3019445 RepID=UPI0023E3897C|nr:SDR family NAD(P)-dependent oxidoreductase [Paracoccus sp. DMF-8]MDF3607652.1 SDR family NAD(P)-dependent oxidoreductase [Paracoccus sp. DMF-8]
MTKIGKTCIVTGGGRGMGAAIAREMAARGYDLVLMSPSDSCEKLAAELGGAARRGVSQSAEDLRAITDLAMATHGRIDAVLNHTGGPPKGDLLDITDEDWIRGNEMVVLSVVRMARLVTPVMQAQGGGSIVNVTSYAAFEPSLMFPTSGVYRTAVSSFAMLVFGPLRPRQYPHELPAARLYRQSGCRKVRRSGGAETHRPGR